MILEKIDKGFGSEASLVNDRGKSFALQIFVVKRHRYAKVRHAGMFKDVVTSGSVMDEESCSAQGADDFLGTYSGKVPTHAGMATRIFSLTGFAENFGSEGIGSPSLRRLSKYARMASLAIRFASLNVSPSVTSPGKAGHVTT
jgi:hypothetical protein